MCKGLHEEWLSELFDEGWTLKASKGEDLTHVLAAGIISYYHSFDMYPVHVETRDPLMRMHAGGISRGDGVHWQL